MGEGAYSNSKPIYLGRYIALYAVLFYYVAFCSVSTIHFLLIPFTLRVMHIGWLIFIDKRWNMLAVLLCIAAFVRFILSKSSKEYSTEAEDLLSQSSYVAFELPSHPPLSPPSSLLSPPSSPPSSFTSPRSSLSPSWSFAQSSPRSSFSSPPFKMRPYKSSYIRMASNASISSEDSGDSDIDSKAEKFISQFRSRLKFEKESDSVCE
ncbi:hypothetical protein HA466_0221040 [Hirschfeldia incana]|nr:hypothetical protein HA466_0221040 [Hirschfeldia incana]